MMAVGKMRRYLEPEIALVISLLVHALAFALCLYWVPISRLALVKPLVKLMSAPSLPARRTEPPVTTVTFVEVPAAPPKPQRPNKFMETEARQVTGAQPKQTEFYSDKPTVAANPSNPTGKSGDTPYLQGKETRLMSTATVNPQSGAGALPTPVAPPAAASPKKVTEQGLTVVEEKKLAMAEPPAAAKPAPVPVALPTEAPREIAALRSKMDASGVAQMGIAAFNVAGSPFGAYDKAIIRAVQSRWYRLISQNGLYERTGEVTVNFDLLADGSVQNLSVKNNTAGQILALFCEKAIVDSAPFTPLPQDLRELIGGEPRDVNFTFYY